VIVDALGNPLAISLTGGQVHDIAQAEALVALVEPKALLANKGYDADRFVESLKVRAIKPVIPPKSNRKIKRDCDFALNAERNLVERSGASPRAGGEDRAQFPRRPAFGLHARLA
jgi:transposase